MLSAAYVEFLALAQSGDPRLEIVVGGACVPCIARYQFPTVSAHSAHPNRYECAVDADSGMNQLHPLFFLDLTWTSKFMVLAGKRDDE